MPTRRRLPRFGLSLLALFAAVPLLAGEPADAPHWAFVPPVRPPVPTPKNADWAKHPIDAFLAAEHERLGLRPSEPAPKHVLLRRVYLDLIGLPPTPQELETFLADTSPEAYEKVVDRLLASPRYGERWGRHWMDVWRYSDWYGYGNELRNSQKHLWRWRDWIIESLNADKPYARMIVEMLAADEAAPGDADALRATGFLARNYYKFNRNVWLDNSVEHTAKAFLGVTVNCAKCHEHKYDPIAQEDYYRFRAVFEPHKLRLDRVPGQADPEKDGLARVYDADLDAPTYLFNRGDEKQPVKDKSLAPGLPEVLAPAGLTIRPVELPVAAYYPGAQSFVRQEAIRSAREKIAKAEAALGQAKKLPAGKAATLAVSAAEKQLAAANAHLAALEARIAADEAKYASPPAPNAEELAKAAHDAAANERHLTAEADLAAAEKALADAEQALKPDDAKLKKAVEDAKKKVEELTKKRDEAKQALGKPGTDYPPLTPVYPSKSTGRRLALAKWIADEKNPLTARVAVNHVWLRHFGRPLVPTVFDFGKNGQPPTHPELLDWLAVDFMESGWSMKHLHRLIVTSRAYRQSSVPRPALRAPRSEDPDNVYLWRMNSRRMESEIVRDSLLHVAGKLDLTMGGPELDHNAGQTTFRRSVYYRHAPEKQMTFMEVFDGANPTECYRRVHTIVPQQALALANSELALNMARTLAGKLSEEVGRSPDAETAARFIRAAYLHVLTRQPSDAETAACAEFLAEQAKLLADPGALEPIAGGAKPARIADPQQRARENLVHVLLNHHEFVTIR